MARTSNLKPKILELKNKHPDLTQAQIAEKLGCSVPTVGNALRGESPSKRKREPSRGNEIDVAKFVLKVGNCDKAKKEWKRFDKELMKHEEEHVDAMFDEMKAIGGEVVNIAKSIEDADRKVAVKKAVAEWETDVKALIDKTKIEARLKKVNDALDGKSGHGPRLDTSIT